jgi:hypothetical protein
MSVTLVRNGKRPYTVGGCIDMDFLHDKLGGVDTDREVWVSKSNDFEATRVKAFGHWDPGFDEKCGVGWGKLSGQLPAL